MATNGSAVGLAELASLKDQALDAAANGVIIGDATREGFPVVYVNAGFERITGYSLDEVCGQSCAMLQGPESDPLAMEELASALRHRRECRTTILNYRKDGTPFWNEIYLAPVFGEDGELVSYIGVQSDVTDRRRAEDQISYLAYHDTLTGLGNRALLRKVMERTLERAQRHQLGAALLFLDLDNFKRINDSLGHEAGDELLRLVADRLRTTMRSGDLLARQGGDEFLILLGDIEGDPRLAAERAGEKIRAALGPTFHVAGRDFPVRASVGISLFPSDAEDPTALMRHADAAMYVAKRSGGGYRFFSRRDALRPAAQRNGGNAELAHELRRVLDERNVTPVFQPIVSLATREPVAFEALARGPQGSALESPGALFPAAQRAGALAELDWICRVRALEIAQTSGAASDLPIFVNAEPETLASPCPEDLRPVWDQGHGRVFVEITERALTARPAELLQEVARIRERGWGVALDDVGADVRSLALMPLLRPDVIKLDLRLVQEQPTTEIASIVNAVRAERERTGAAILAEGIETEEHLETATAMGATYGQGWLFARPGALDPSVAGGRGPEILTGDGEVPEGTPYGVFAPVREVRRADKRLLLSTSMHLEHQALRIGEGAVVMSAFQDAERFTPLTVRRYTALGSDAALVAALGVGMPVEPAPGVRGAEIGPGDELAGEWSVVVLGPHFAGALVAVDLGDEGPDMDRRFDFVVSYDRDLVIKAAATILRRVAPLGQSG